MFDEKRLGHYLEVPRATSKGDQMAIGESALGSKSFGAKKKKFWLLQTETDLF